MMMNNPAPWSYSKLTSFEKCPKQFYHLRVKRDYQEELSPAIELGNLLHKATEKYINNRTKIPEKFSFMENCADAMMKKGVHSIAEFQFGITPGFNSAAYWERDNLPGMETWVRGSVDLVVYVEENVKGPETIYLVDWKTGKNTKYADLDQLNLMALGMFANYSSLLKIHAGLVFVYAGELISETYTREDIKSSWDNWKFRYSRMKAAYDTGEWDAKPSGLCRAHCPVIECPHNGRR